MKLEEKVSSKSFTVAAVDQPEPILPTVDQEKGSTGLSVSDDVKPTPPPTSSPSTSDGAFDVPLGEEPESAGVSEDVPEHETGEQQTKSQ